MVDEHWAKDDICESVDLFACAQVVDEKLSETSAVGETPSKKIDTGYDRLGIGILNSVLTFKFGL